MIGCQLTLDKQNMKTLLLSVALLTSLYGPQQVSSFSSGAPPAACDTLSPNPTQHGAQPQSTEVPYSIDLSPLCNNGRLMYSPEQTYTCEFVTRAASRDRLNQSRYDLLYRVTCRQYSTNYATQARLLPSPHLLA